MDSAESQSAELIDTAIVIKNIPFGYREEDFLNKLFPQLGLVPPYAFNYHRNKSDRAFHGLAFANFNAAHEAQAAVDVLNNFELDRRRLRVELKKRLPAEEERQREERQKIARQTRRQLTLQTTTPTGFQSVTPDIQPTSSHPLEPMEMAPDILDPILRPRILYPGPPTPTPQTGNPLLTIHN
jgi:RNA recognition motif-containing protein